MNEETPWGLNEKNINGWIKKKYDGRRFNESM